MCVCVCEHVHIQYVQHVVCSCKRNILVFHMFPEVEHDQAANLEGSMCENACLSESVCVSVCVCSAHNSMCVFFVFFFLIKGKLQSEPGDRDLTIKL